MWVCTSQISVKSDGSGLRILGEVNVEDVVEFIYRVKGSGYFKEGEP